MMAALDGHNGIYHAATRTGQISAIWAPTGGLLPCCFLWLRLSEVGFAGIRKPQVRRRSQSH
jgi:hypothetical protein